MATAGDPVVTWGMLSQILIGVGIIGILLSVLLVAMGPKPQDFDGGPRSPRRNQLKRR